jgi:hypothetical protein
MGKASRRLIQSRRNVWFCIHDNEPTKSKEIHWKKVLLESENTPNNKNTKTKKETQSRI